MPDAAGRLRLVGSSPGAKLGAAGQALECRMCFLCPMLHPIVRGELRGSSCARSCLARPCRAHRNLPSIYVYADRNDSAALRVTAARSVLLTIS